MKDCRKFGQRSRTGVYWNYFGINRELEEKGMHQIIQKLVFTFSEFILEHLQLTSISPWSSFGLVVTTTKFNDLSQNKTKNVNLYKRCFFRCI